MAELQSGNVWEELVFQARLKYLAFKRSIMLMEVVILLMTALCMFVVAVPQPWFALVVIVQVCKIAGEHWNHWHLSQIFGAGDRWTWFPLVLLT
jgi:hypothetical protein